MKTIWKYQIESTHHQKSFQMPRGASVVRVGAQGTTVCLWAVVFPDPDPNCGAETETRKFLVSGTGEPVHVAMKYVGSVSIGVFEWHVWEVPHAAV